MSYRHTALFVDALKVGRPLDREQRHKILWLAERAERSSKGKGRQSGCLGLSGLHVLRTLLTFVGKDGLCCPSIATLQDRTGLARATVVKALKALEAMGLLVVVRRLVRRWIERTNGWTGEPERILTCVQSSNAYRFEPAASIRVQTLDGRTRQFHPTRAPLLSGLLTQPQPWIDGARGIAATRRVR